MSIIAWQNISTIAWKIYFNDYDWLELISLIELDKNDNDEDFLPKDIVYNSLPRHVRLQALDIKRKVSQSYWLLLYYWFLCFWLLDK